MSFVANIIHFSLLHKFLESVKIRQSYREFKGGNLFETVYLYAIYYKQPHCVKNR